MTFSILIDCNNPIGDFNYGFTSIQFDVDGQTVASFETNRVSKFGYLVRIEIGKTEETINILSDFQKRLIKDTLIKKFIEISFKLDSEYIRSEYVYEQKYISNILWNRHEISDESFILLLKNAYQCDRLSSQEMHEEIKQMILDDKFNFNNLQNAKNT